jgi:hypothetical protein
MLGDNTSNVTPFFLPANGSTNTQSINGSGGAVPNRWYVTSLRAGHCYCAESVLSFTTGGTGDLGISVMSFFQGDGVTPMAEWNTFEMQAPDLDMFASGPMGSSTGSTRYCNVIPGTDNSIVIVFIRTAALFLNAGSTLTYRISISDTTLFAPWFYTDSNYEAFTQVQNTSSTNIVFTVTHYKYVASSGGSTSVLGLPFSFDLAPFGSTFIPAKGAAFVGAPGDGGIKITYKGPPGALKANVTSVNATGVGLTHSFNIPFQTVYPAQMLAQ